MMRAQEKQRPCGKCGQNTRFEKLVVGPRGGVKGWVPVCVHCGERHDG